MRRVRERVRGVAAARARDERGARLRIVGRAAALVRGGRGGRVGRAERAVVEAGREQAARVAGVRVAARAVEVARLGEVLRDALAVVVEVADDPARLPVERTLRPEQVERLLEHRGGAGRVGRLEQVGAARAAHAAAELARVPERAERLDLVVAGVRGVADVVAALDVAEVARAREQRRGLRDVGLDHAAARVQEAEQRARRAELGVARLPEQLHAVLGLALGLALHEHLRLVVLVLRRQLRRGDHLDALALLEAPRRPRVAVMDGRGRERGARSEHDGEQGERAD